MTAKFTHEIIDGHIIHLNFNENKDLCDAFIRFSEHYESQHPEIKGKIFTLGYLKSLGVGEADWLNSYCGGDGFDSAWAGFNIPKRAFEPFIKGLFDPLTPEETDIIDLIRYTDKPFYMIGTFGDVIDDEEGEITLKHELRHAYYDLDPDFQTACDAVIEAEFAAGGARFDRMEKFMDVMFAMGYDTDVMFDEAQAYISTDVEWPFEDKYLEMMPNGFDYIKDFKKVAKKLKKIEFDPKRVV